LAMKKSLNVTCVIRNKHGDRGSETAIRASADETVISAKDNSERGVDQKHESGENCNRPAGDQRTVNRPGSTHAAAGTRKPWAQTREVIDRGPRREHRNAIERTGVTVLNGAMMMFATVRMKYTRVDLRISTEQDQAGEASF
jgi:hypothetical protein